MIFKEENTINFTLDGAVFPRHAAKEKKIKIEKEKISLGTLSKTEKIENLRGRMSKIGHSAA